MVLEELLGEIGFLASVYHKPAETFVGRGRVGADSLRKVNEYVAFGSYQLSLFAMLICDEHVAWTMSWLPVKKR